MKNFLSFSIICWIMVPTILAEKFLELELETYMPACARELNVKKEWSFIERQWYITPKDEYCMLICSIRKYVIEDLIGPNNKATFYNMSLKMIDEAYKAGFESSKFTREDVVKKMENCYATVQTECEFAKCTNDSQLRFESVFQYVNRKHLLHTVFNTSL